MGSDHPRQSNLRLQGLAVAKCDSVGPEVFRDDVGNSRGSNSLMRPMFIMLVVGARPNFMKAAPLLEELRRHPKTFQTILIHTGQHYDTEMSDVFFQDLELPRPDLSLGVGSGSHAEQT